MKLFESLVTLIMLPVTLPILILVWVCKQVKNHPVLTVLALILFINYCSGKEAEAVPGGAVNQTPYIQETVTETQSWQETAYISPVAVQTQYVPPVDPVQASLPWSHRNGGVCRTLTEDASVRVIFLEDDESDWTVWEMNNFMENMICPAFDFIEYQASRYGCTVDLDYIYYIDENRNPDATYYEGSVAGFAPDYVNDNIHETVAWTRGFTSAEEMLRADRNYSGNDQIAYLFVLDKPGRSYAYWNSGTGDYIEGAVVFTSQEGYRERSNVVAHELMHLFGAEDIYAEGSERVNRAAMAQWACPNEIFLAYQWDIFDNTVSDFTAYTVGWLNNFPEQYRAAEWWS